MLHLISLGKFYKELLEQLTGTFNWAAFFLVTCIISFRLVPLITHYIA